MSDMIAAIQRVSEVLADHQIQDGPGQNLGQYRTEYTCSCGAPVISDAHAEVSLLAARVTHQAESLVVAGMACDEATIKAEALEEAAVSKKLVGLYPGTGDWLRERAMKLRMGERL